MDEFLRERGALSKQRNVIKHKMGSSSPWTQIYLDLQEHLCFLKNISNLVFYVKCYEYVGLCHSIFSPYLNKEIWRFSVSPHKTFTFLSLNYFQFFTPHCEIQQLVPQEKCSGTSSPDDPKRCHLCLLNSTLELCSKDLLLLGWLVSSVCTTDWI